VIDWVNSDLRCHPLCHEALRLWVDHAVFFRDQRDFKVAVPSDCVASETKRHYRFALEHMTRRLKADTRPSDKIRFR
jgi:hypothetical protein